MISHKRDKKVKEDHTEGKLTYPGANLEVYLVLGAKDTAETKISGQVSTW